MKILLYSANFAPEQTGIGKYSGEMAAWLASQGHEVRVVAAPPYYPSWELGEGYAWPPYRRDQWHGVDVWRAPLWVPRNPNGVSRILHLLTFAISSLPVMLWQVVWRPDVVMTVAPALMCAPTGWIVAKLSGGKAWLHIQDFEVDVAFQMGLLKGKFLKNFVLGSERWLLSWFDVVSSISENMLSKLQIKGVVEGRIRFFPNWVDIAHIYPLTQPSHYRQELGIKPNVKVVLFSGTLSNKQGLMVIPDAARKLASRDDILFVVCGNGVMKPQLEEACNGLNNVRFIPLQPFENLGQLLGLADIHLLPQSPEASDLVLPSKLSGMLASGMPIIATCGDGTEIASVVSKCGLVVPPEDGGELALAIGKLVDNDEERLKLGVQARIYSEENLARDSVLGRLLEQFTVPSRAPINSGIQFKHFVNKWQSKIINICQNLWFLQKKTVSIEPTHSKIIHSPELPDTPFSSMVSIPKSFSSFRCVSEMGTVGTNFGMSIPVEHAASIASAIKLIEDDEDDEVAIERLMQLRFGVRSRLYLNKIKSSDLQSDAQVNLYN